MNKLRLLLPFYLLLFILPNTGYVAPLVFGPGAEAPAKPLDNIVAVVDDDIITQRELNKAIMMIERQMRQNKVPIPPRPALEKQVLERLILSQLQIRTAERNGIVVDDATLNAAIEALAQRNNVSLDQLRQTVEKDGIDFAQFRDEVRRELTAARLRQQLVDSKIQISEQDVESLQAQLASTNGGSGGVIPNRGASRASSGNRQYHIAQILVAVPEGASPDEIAAAKRQAEEVLSKLRGGADFQQLAAGVSAGQQALEGGDLGWRRVDQLPTMFAKVVPALQPGQFSEPVRSPSGFHIVKLLEVQGGSGEARPQKAPSAAAPKAATITQTHARHILLKTSPQLSDDEAQQKAKRVRQRIVNGEDFAALARANSDDSGSATNGGDLGWVSPGMLVPPFEQAMDRLQPNEVSQPVQTQFGWHIIQVLERRQTAGTSKTEHARVREALFRRRAEEEWELMLRRMREEAYVEIRLQEATGDVSETTQP